MTEGIVGVDMEIRFSSLNRATIFHRRRGTWGE